MNASHNLLTAFILLLAAATALSACGRKGPLDRPGVTAAPEPETGEFGSLGGFGDDDVEDVPPRVPERRFILDPLID